LTIARAPWRAKSVNVGQRVSSERWNEKIIDKKVSIDRPYRGNRESGPQGDRCFFSAMRAVMLAVVILLVLTPFGIGGRHAATAAEPRDPRCAAGPVSEARASFRAAYAAGKFGDAASALEAIWVECGLPHKLAPEMAGAIANDRALALHRAGNDHDCLDALQEYWPNNRSPTRAFARLSPGLRQAIKFNWRLCLPGCSGAPGFDAVCESLAANEQSERVVQGFRHIACPFWKGQSAIALPDGTCLAVLASRKHFESSTADQEDPHNICPIPARVTRNGGRTIVRELRTPDRSFLLSLEHCCDSIDLTIDVSGRIAAEPHENPPEGCIFGHRTSVMQDIFRLEGDKLHLVKQLSQPWFP
jgi:hypothetical protein